MVKVGVYIFARGLMSAGEIPEIIGIVGVVMATITLIYGFIMYLPQTDLKRLLAYSTITQLSYIFLALSLSAFGSEMAFDGGIAYIFNHAFAKSLFFTGRGRAQLQLRHPYAAKASRHHAPYAAAGSGVLRRGNGNHRHSAV